MNHVEFPTDTDLITIGQDKRMKTWKISEMNGSPSITRVYESSNVFLSKPAGIELVKLRDKYILYIALEDGSLIKQEVKFKTKTLDVSSLLFGSNQTLEGNGNGIVKMSSSEEYLIIEHSRGLVSLWSIKGSEICHYDRKSSATFFTNQAILGKDKKFPKLLLASTDLEILSPFESECLEKFCGHQGEIKGLLATRSNTLITAGLDGKLRHWNYSLKRNKEQAVDEIIGLKFISCPTGTSFLSLSKSGILGCWSWDEDHARVVSSGSLELDRYELMSAVVVDGNIFMVTAARNGKITLYEVIKEGSTLETKFISNVSLGDRPLGLYILVDDEDRRNDGQFSVLYSASNTLYVMKARTKIITRGPRPSLMMMGALYPENWVI